MSLADIHVTLEVPEVVITVEELGDIELTLELVPDLKVLAVLGPAGIQGIQGPEGPQGPSGGGVTDHGALTGLSDNDHPQYALQGTAAYTVTNATTDRTFNANSYTMDELADVLGTLIADLKVSGVID